METPEFKPLVPGVEQVLQWVPRPNVEVELLHYLDQVLSQWDNVNLTKGVTLKRVGEKEGFTFFGDPEVSILDTLVNFVKQHVVRVRLLDIAEEFSGSNELEETSRCKYLQIPTLPTTNRHKVGFKPHFPHFHMISVVQKT